MRAKEFPLAPLGYVGTWRVGKQLETTAIFPAKTLVILIVKDADTNPPAANRALRLR